MNWVEVTVHTTTEGAEIVANALEMAGAGGAVIEDKADLARYQRSEGDWDYIDEEIGAKMSEDVLVKGYLPDDARIPDSSCCSGKRWRRLHKWIWADSL